MLAWHVLYWLSCLPSPGSLVIEHLISVINESSLFISDALIFIESLLELCRREWWVNRHCSWGGESIHPWKAGRTGNTVGDTARDAHRGHGYGEALSRWSMSHLGSYCGVGEAQSQASRRTLFITRTQLCVEVRRSLQRSLSAFLFWYSGVDEWRHFWINRKASEEWKLASLAWKILKNKDLEDMY